MTVSSCWERIGSSTTAELIGSTYCFICNGELGGILMRSLRIRGSIVFLILTLTGIGQSQEEPVCVENSPERRGEIGCSIVEKKPQGLFSRAFHNDDLLPKIRKPVLITPGAKDAIVSPSVIDQHRRAMPHAQIQLMADVGHAAFWEDAGRFNERLRVFCQNL